MVMNADSPRYVGGLLPIHSDTTADANGNVVSLVGATAPTLKLVNQLTGAVTTCTGTATITNAAQGLWTYPWQTGDLAVAGTFDLFVTASYSGVAREFDPTTIVILAHP